MSEQQTSYGTDNTTGTVRVLDEGNEEMVASVATLLGPKFNMPKAGIVRPGIMKLKSGTSAQDQAIYKQMLEEGATWDAIEKRLGTDNSKKSKLIPANVDYFTIRPADCQNQANVAEIYRLYADKTDGKLRSIPVWFPVNNWWDILPHSLRCFSASGIKFKSAFKEVTNGYKNVVRVCEYPLAAEAGKRTFGGRPWAERPCDPNTCPEYQAGECKLGGTIQFFIPGIPGLGIWILPTTSWYSLVRIKSALEAVAGLTGGRLARLLINGKSPFIIRKIYDEIATIDTKTGKPMKRSQWLIDLDVQIDMFELAQAYENQAVLARGQRAVAALTGGTPQDSMPDKPAGKVYQMKAPGAVETTQEFTDEDLAPLTGEEGDWVPDMEGPEMDERNRLETIARCKVLFDKLSPGLKKEYKQTHPKPIDESTLEEALQIEEQVKLALATMGGN